jgi:hypothetical protein
MTFKATQAVAQVISKQQDFFYYKYLQGIQDYRLYKTHRIQNYDEQGSNKKPVEFDSGNDYVLLIATRQNTLYSATLFSSKEEGSVSKIGVNGTARQHGLGKAHRQQSTQV